MRRIIGAVAGLAVVVGLALMGSPIAEAKTIQPKVTISAPASVTRGQTITIRGTVTYPRKHRLVYVQERHGASVTSRPWRTFAVVRASKKTGKWSARLSVDNNSSYQFRAYEPKYKGSKKAISKTISALVYWYTTVQHSTVTQYTNALDVGTSKVVQVGVDGVARHYVDQSGTTVDAVLRAAVDEIVQVGISGLGVAKGTLSTTSGPLAGGTRLTISGSGFTTTTAVTFLPLGLEGWEVTGVPATVGTNLVVSGDTSLTVTVPQNLPGPATVSIVNGLGAQKIGTFTYVSVDRQPTAFEAQVLATMNVARTTARYCATEYMPPADTPLTWDTGTADFALAYSEDRVLRLPDYQAAYPGISFTHNWLGQQSPQQKFWELGGWWADNDQFTEIALIGGGTVTAQDVVDGWLASPAHCERVMQSRWTKVGIGVYGNDGDQTHTAFVTADLR